MLPILLTLLRDESDRQVFTDLYRQYTPKLMAVAARYFPRDSQAAEDAVQNAWMNVIRHFEKISEISCNNLPFWLVSIVKNEAITLLRRQRDVLPLEDWDAVAPETADGNLEYRAVVALFARLPESYAAVLELQYLHGLTHREIARKLQLTEAAVRVRASRGRALLRELAEKEGFHP